MPCQHLGRVLQGTTPVKETHHIPQPHKRYQLIAQLLDAARRCERNKDPAHKVWTVRHMESIAVLMTSAPSGSGFDNGTTFDAQKSTPEVLRFNTAFHHMNESGMYDGWTEHTITVRASLPFGYLLSVSGRDRNRIKEYISEVFYAWLDEEKVSP